MNKPVDTLLAALLEREMSERLDGFAGVPAELPRRLWETALLGPAREFLQRPGKAFRARLVALSWALGGGAPDALPEELPLVVEILHAGSLIVDDIQDQSEFRRGRPTLHQIYGMPVALNTGNWLYFWSLVVLGRNLPAHRAAAVQSYANTTLMRCHQGQALDLSVRIFDLGQAEVGPAVAASTGLKTGALMEFAAMLGASCADAPTQQCELLARFGHRLGVALQQLDDLGGLIAESRWPKGTEDLRLARLTWPWAWLAEVAPAQVFTELQARVRDLAGRSTHDQDESGYLANLRAEIAALVADTGRAQTSAGLANALDELHRELGPSVHLDALQQEVQLLEKSYG